MPRPGFEATTAEGRAMKALIKVTLKNGVLDPQGRAIQTALGAMGMAGIDDVRQGKFIEVHLQETDEAKARVLVDRMCRELLANTVIETYSFDLVR
jgi:phosphoribosylformylglycinamidine synthase subunit PurS